MAEYIERQAAIDAIDCDITITGRQNAELVAATIGTFADRIKALPAADVAPVVHGHWEYIDDTYCGFKDTDVRCSVCKTTTNIKRFRKTKWCPDCGAKMDEEE